MEKINEMNILITGIGGPTPRSIARSIKISTKFKHASLIGTDSNPLAYGLYQSELYSKTYVVPRADSEKYWEVLEDIIDKHKIDLALIHPEMEVALWAERERITGTIPVKALLPDSSVARSLVSKSEMSNILEGEDFIPKSYAFSPSDLDIDYLESILPYPFWIRSSSGSSGLGRCYCWLWWHLWGSGGCARRSYMVSGLMPSNRRLILPLWALATSPFG
jgi:carbamoyl-phosphate synthase large subunit